MCVNEINSTDAGVTDVRIDVIDSWHRSWPEVLSHFAEKGHHDRLLVDQDGWLSARQVLMVAFARDAVVGHIVFRLIPRANHRMDDLERPKVDARLDSLEVSPGHNEENVRRMLTTAATERAQALRVGNFGGINE